VLIMADRMLVSRMNISRAGAVRALARAPRLKVNAPSGAKRARTRS
jgi:hypothetical protein